MDRKEFLLKTTAVCGFASAVALLDSCSKINSVNFTIDLSNPANAALLTNGGHVIQNGVFVRKTANGYVALSLTCTHNGCTVVYTGGLNGAFDCPCHRGTYDINGNVTGGPPPAPLSKLMVTENANVLTITG
jgi:Rieske Fe-S protein